MAHMRGRPGRHPDPTQPSTDFYLGWLARTHRYNADSHLANATTFAKALTEAKVPIGPSMISRLEGGTARWRLEHLVAYAEALGLPVSWFTAPAHKLGKVLGRGDLARMLRSTYTEDDEQTAADIVDAVRADDSVTTADWDLLTGYLLWSRRRLGIRTQVVLCRRLLLEICATQGADQDIRVEALIRLRSLQHVADTATAAAIAAAEQPGNPSSFVPLKVFQRTPRTAPSRWITQALRNPPDRWLLRELFTSVAVLVDSGSWEPSSAQLGVLRVLGSDATLDASLELEVRRASMQLLGILDERAVAAVLRRSSDSDLLYLGKHTAVDDEQILRYATVAAIVAAQVQERGLRHQRKWAAGEDRTLFLIVREALFGRKDAIRGALTTLLVNSGYRFALRDVLASRLADPSTFDDVTVVRALVRLLGKVGAHNRDGQLLHSIATGDRIDVDTRIQALWALSNAAPRLPPKVVLDVLNACSARAFGVQSVTALRAAVSACARSGLTTPLLELLAEPSIAWEVRRECQWWLSLPSCIADAGRSPFETAAGAGRLW